MLNSLTLGEASTELADFLKEGKEAFMLNSACERLLAKGKYRGFTARARFIVREDGQITLPADFETLIGATLDGRPQRLRDPWYEFVPKASACEEGDYLRSRDLGDGFVTYRSLSDVTTGTGIRLSAEDAEEVTCTISGRLIADSGGDVESFDQTLTFTGPSEIPVIGDVTEITGFKKSRTDGRVFLEAQQADSSWLRVACFEPRDTKVSLRRYALPGAEAGDTVVGLCKRRFRKAEQDADPLAVDSIYALSNALEALSYESAGDPQTAATFWSLAISHLDDALSEHRGGANRTVPVFYRGAGASKLRAIR